MAAHKTCSWAVFSAQRSPYAPHRMQHWPQRLARRCAVPGPHLQAHLATSVPSYQPVRAHRACVRGCARGLPRGCNTGRALSRGAHAEGTHILRTAVPVFTPSMPYYLDKQLWWPSFGARMRTHIHTHAHSYSRTAVGRPRCRLLHGEHTGNGLHRRSHHR